MKEEIWIKLCLVNNRAMGEPQKTLLHHLARYGVTPKPNWWWGYNVKVTDTSIFERMTLEEVAKFVESLGSEPSEPVEILAVWPSLSWGNFSFGWFLKPKTYVFFDFHQYAFVEGEEPFCEDVAELIKDLCSDLQIDFGLGGWERWFFDYDPPYYKEFERLEREEVLDKIPSLALKERSIWFYVLSKNRYEQSKPWLSQLPFRQVQQLSSGAVFLFVTYPFDFDQIRLEKQEGWYDDCDFQVYQPITEAGKKAAR